MHSIRVFGSFLFFAVQIDLLLLLCDITFFVCSVTRFLDLSIQSGILSTFVYRRDRVRKLGHSDSFGLHRSS